ncbi:hypothetical protein GCM10010411_78430 [Actinomadura fulvescens]|uniref:Uncharacterized protein n=1 Tax=Actinomadura fulvescens TaxID=46160 RepID=A0ABN3QL42_9ACTN
MTEAERSARGVTSLAERMRSAVQYLRTFSAAAWVSIRLPSLSLATAVVVAVPAEGPGAACAVVVPIPAIARMEAAATGTSVRRIRRMTLP